MFKNLMYNLYLIIMDFFTIGKKLVFIAKLEKI